MWKAYYYIYLVLTILGLFTLLPKISSFNLATWESIVESIVLVLGTYSFIFKKYVFTNKVWRNIFIFISAIWTLQMIFYSNAFPAITPMIKFVESSYPQNYNDVALSIFLSIPALVAIHKIGFNKKN